MARKSLLILMQVLPLCVPTPHSLNLVKSDKRGKAVTLLGTKTEGKTDFFFFCKSFHCTFSCFSQSTKWHDNSGKKLWLTLLRTSTEGKTDSSSSSASASIVRPNSWTSCVTLGSVCIACMQEEEAIIMWLPQKKRRGRSLGCKRRRAALLICMPVTPVARCSAQKLPHLSIYIDNEEEFIWGLHGPAGYIQKQWSAFIWCWAGHMQAVYCTQGHWLSWLIPADAQLNNPWSLWFCWCCLCGHRFDHHCCCHTCRCTSTMKRSVSQALAVSKADESLVACAAFLTFCVKYARHSHAHYTFCTCWNLPTRKRTRAWLRIIFRIISIVVTCSIPADVRPQWRGAYHRR